MAYNAYKNYETIVWSCAHSIPKNRGKNRLTQSQFYYWCSGNSSSALIEKFQSYGGKVRAYTKESVDLSKNIIRIKSFGYMSQDIVRRFNKKFSNDEFLVTDFFIKSVVGKVVNLIGNPASILYSIVSSTNSPKQTNLKARIMDQVVFIEFIGKIGFELYYVQQLRLIDPFRVKAYGKEASWVFHEERFPVYLQMSDRLFKKYNPTVTYTPRGTNTTKNEPEPSWMKKKTHH